VIIAVAPSNYALIAGMADGDADAPAARMRRTT